MFELIKTMNYNLYLFSNLVKFYDIEFDDLPYDEQYALLPGMYRQFEKSVYNKEESDLYECIMRYLNHTYSTY